MRAFVLDVILDSAAGVVEEDGAVAGVDVVEAGLGSGKAETGKAGEAGERCERFVSHIFLIRSREWRLK